MKRKVCIKCHKKKLLTEFYRHSQMADGRLSKCIVCSKGDAIDNYKKKSKDNSFIDAERKRGREKYRRLYVGFGKANVARNMKYLAKYPEKEAAKNYSANLKKPFDGGEKHHWSYNEEHYKDVLWLNKKEHKKAHRFLIYDQEQMMYRRNDSNELLDTKEKHEVFIMWCIKNKED